MSEQIPEVEVDSMSSSEITKYVASNFELPPDVDSGLLEKLNARMSQEEIVTFHIVENTIPDKQKRAKMLETWIPRPHQFYHVSQNGSIDEFVPLPSKRLKDEPDSVFAATTRSVAAMFGIKSDYTKSGSYDGGKTWTIIVGDAKKFLEDDKGCYMYTLPPEDFTVNPDLGLGLAEWTCPKAVKPTKMQHFDSAIEIMLDSGVNIIPVSSEEMAKLRDPQIDDLSVLSGHNGIKSVEDLRVFAKID
jgi:hypothetical protein